jgi:hypothetical protein
MNRARSAQRKCLAWCAPLQDIELMPQYQDFGFQSAPRLEAVAQHADEKEGNCNHATIML